MATAVLRMVGPHRPQLAADLFGLLNRLQSQLLAADQHLDGELNLFFQRVELALPPDLDSEWRAAFAASIARACDSWEMTHSLRFSDEPRRVAIFASQRGHCALDLLQRHRHGELPCEIAFVASHHADLAEEVARRGYHFVHEPLVDEARLEAHLTLGRVDLVVLARYLQSLSPPFVERWSERAINVRSEVHGKLIQATSHYLTRELVIVEEVAAISHRDNLADRERKGRELERRVLARAVLAHLEDRILPSQTSTVVFD